MRRRSFLGVFSATAVVLSGCASGSDAGAEETTTTQPPTDGETTTATPTDTATPTSSLTPSRVGARLTLQGPMGPRRTSVQVEDGQVVYTVDCNGDDDGLTRTVERAVTSETAAELADLVAAADPSAWKAYYDCKTDCPTDAPSVALAVTVEGRTYETGYYTGRQEPLPADLRPIVDLLDGLRVDLHDEVDSIDCHAQ